MIVKQAAQWPAQPRGHGRANGAQCGGAAGLGLVGKRCFQRHPGAADQAVAVGHQASLGLQCVAAFGPQGFGGERGTAQFGQSAHFAQQHQLEGA